jgi:hypothetical protein
VPPSESGGWLWLRPTFVSSVITFEASGAYMPAWTFISLKPRLVGATEDGPIPVLTDFSVEELLRGLRVLGRGCHGGGFGGVVRRNCFDVIK